MTYTIRPVQNSVENNSRIAADVVSQYITNRTREHYELVNELTRDAEGFDSDLL